MKRDEIKYTKPKKFEATGRSGDLPKARLGLVSSPNAPAGAPLFGCLQLTRDGFIKIHRIIQDHPIKKDHAAFLLFFHLLCDAEWKDGAQRFFNGRQITLKRGQLTCGRYELSKSIGLPPSTVRNALKRLQSKYQIVDYQKDTHYSLVTILKYDRYQDNSLKMDDKVDNDRTPSGQQQDTLEEVKKVRSKEKSYIARPKSIQEVKTFFKNDIEAEKFWNHFESNGWKVGGKAPMKNWQAAAKNWLSRINPSEILTNGRYLTKAQRHSLEGLKRLEEKYADKDVSESIETNPKLLS